VLLKGKEISFGGKKKRGTEKPDRGDIGGPEREVLSLAADWGMLVGRCALNVNGGAS